MSAGSSVRATISALEAEGAIVVAVGCLVMMGDRAQDLEPRCLERLPYRLWEPADCPHCAAAIPLERPGRAEGEVSPATRIGTS